MSKHKKSKNKDYQIPADEMLTDDGTPVNKKKRAKGDPAYGAIPSGPVAPDPESAAQHLQRFGLGKDTILAHITEEEAQVLKQRGGSGAVNPYTGLLEFDGDGTGEGEGSSSGPGGSSGESGAAAGGAGPGGPECSMSSA